MYYNIVRVKSQFDVKIHIKTGADYGNPFLPG
jgi:hypothetical protein